MLLKLHYIVIWDFTDSDLVDLRWQLKVCISDKLVHSNTAAGQLIHSGVWHLTLYLVAGEVRSNHIILIGVKFLNFTFPNGNNLNNLR